MPKIFRTRTRRKFMNNKKTVNEVPKKPRENLRLIVNPSYEEYFPTTFHDVRAKCFKIIINI